MRNSRLLTKNFDLSIPIIARLYSLSFLVLALILFYYQTIKGNYYFERAKNNYVRVIPLPAIRGSIFDRNNTLLAYDIATFNISVIPYQIKKQKGVLFKNLSEFLDYDLKDIYRNYDKNLQGRFSPVDIIINIEKSTALKLKEKFKDLILVNPLPQRYYPYPYEFAHLLGYVKKATSFYENLKKYGYTPLERVGFSGVEQYYDTYLKGEDGGDLIEADAIGKVVGFLGSRMPKKGKDINLTVDGRLQKIAFNALGDKRGALILMDSNNGEIIVLHSNPSYNSNDFIEGKNISKSLLDKHSPLLNRAIQSKYPIGSIFKPMLGLAALEEKTKPSKTFLCEGVLRLGVTKFKCWSSHGMQNLYQALAHSCNVYFYNLGLLVGPHDMAKWARKFGLNSLSGIDLPYEKKGFIPDPEWKKTALNKSWFSGDTLNFSIGQGFVNITPLEVTTAINCFTNGGYLVKPYVLKRVDNINSELTTKTHIGATDKNISIIKKCLRETVTDPEGTARILKRLNLGLAGKTGTAQTRGKPHGWFVGFFPFTNPQYTICVFLENGGSSYEALKVTYNFLNTAKNNNIFNSFNK